MNIKENLNIKGRLTIKKYDLKGELKDQVKVNNDITYSGRLLVARLFNKDSHEVKRVSKMKLGNKQTDFDPAHTDLQGPVDGWETPIVAIEQLNAEDSRVMLRIRCELAEKDCNGELREAGLFTEDDVMYNRVTFDTITKSDQFTLTLIWEITF